MKPLYLKAVNTYSFGELSLTEEDFQPGVIAGIGDNRDQGGNNGTGKSNIGKIIFYAKKGKEIDGEAKEKITKWGAEGHCVDYAELRDGRVLRIKRYENWTSLPGNLCYEDGEHFQKVRNNSGLKFWIDGELQVGATQATIDSVMTESPDIIKSTTIIQQRSGAPFLTATATKKQERISEMLDNEAYDIGKEKADRDLKEIDKKISNLQQRRETKVTLKESHEKNLERTITQEKSFDELKNKRLLVLKKELAEAKSKVDDLEKTIIEEKDVASLESEEAIQKQALTKAKQEINSLRESTQLNNIREEISSISNKKNEIAKNATEINGIINTLSRSLDEKNEFLLKDKIKTLTMESEITDGVSECSTIHDVMNELRGLQDKAVATKSSIKTKEGVLHSLEHSLVCPTCKRSWDEATMKQKNDEIAMVSSELNELKATLASVESKARETQVVISQHESWIAIQRKKQDVLVLLEKVASFEKTREEINLKKEELSVFKNNIAKLDESISLLKSLENEEIENIKTRTQEKEKEVLELEKMIELVQKQIKDAVAHNNKRATHEKELNFAQTEVKRIKAAGQEVLAEKNPHAETIDDIKKDIELTKAEVGEIDTNLEAFKEDRAYIEYWARNFGAVGIKSFIADDLLIALNEKIQDYLIPLYGGSLFIEFTSETENQKGAVSNKIDTKITYTGHETTQSLISGGELKRIEFAINLALADVAEMYSGVQSKVRFLDEPFDGMCSIGQIKALKMLEKIADERGICYILISHDPGLQNQCKKSFTAVKENGTSRIEKTGLNFENKVA